MDVVHVLFFFFFFLRIFNCQGGGSATVTEM